MRLRILMLLSLAVVLFASIFGNAQEPPPSNADPIMQLRLTPEQRQAGMDAWMAWAGTAGEMITDLGAPLQAVTSTEGKQVTGFSVMTKPQAT